jgi:hypothetical protein
MGNVRKYHYSVDSAGEKLKYLVEYHKMRTEIKARQRAKRSPSAYRNYLDELPGFEGGNDAILIHQVNGNPNTEIRKCANSFVNDSSSSFANIRVNFTGTYTLIPREPSQQFNYICTNKHREIGVGHYRNNDTEYKLLEYISTRISLHQVGHIYLFTYYEPCLSCDYVIIQFAKKYPLIKIDVYFEEEYRPENGVI